MPKSKLRAAASVAIVASAIASPLLAVDRYWVGGDGTWQLGPWSATAGGMGGASAPTNMDNVYLLGTSSYAVQRDAASGNFAFGTVALDGTAGALVGVNQAGATQLNSSTLIVGQSGSAAITFGGSVGGTVVRIGQSAGSVGTITSNGGTFSCSSLTIGQSGAGAFVQNGGTAQIGSLAVGASGAAVGTLLQSAGSLNVTGNATLGSASGAAVGNVFINSGSATFGAGIAVNPGSRFIVSPTASFSAFGSAFSVNRGTLDFGRATITLSPMISVTVTDGFLGVGTLGSSGGSINFQSGTLSTDADFGAANWAALGGATITLPAGKSLIVTGTTTLGGNRPIVLNGGTFSTGVLAGNVGGGLIFSSGTLRLTGSDLLVGAAGSFGATLTVDASRRFAVDNGFVTTIEPDGQVLVAAGEVVSSGGFDNAGVVQLASPVARLGGSVRNGGLLAGTGRIAGSLDNLAAGEVRVTAADSMRIDGATHANAGLINLLGGAIDFGGGTLVNAAGGRIAGRGMIRAGAIDNAGSVLLSAGVSDVFGAFDNNGGAKVIVTGNATAAFYDGLSNAVGSEFRVSTGATAVFFGAVSGLSQFTGSGATVFEGPASSGRIGKAGATVVGPGGAVLAEHIRDGRLSIEGSATIAANGTDTATSRVNSLDVHPGGRLDLADNALVIDFAGVSPRATIESLVALGRAGGAWTGDGIGSSVAAMTPNRALGVAEAIDIGVPPVFAGQPIDATAVLVRYTITGDANLDRAVNIGDFGLLAANFNQPSRWATGDFDYNGTTGIADFSLLAASFNQSLTVEPARAVPEPAATTFCAAGLILLAAGGRQRRGCDVPIVDRASIHW